MPQRWPRTGHSTSIWSCGVCRRRSYPCGHCGWGCRRQFGPAVAANGVADVDLATLAAVDGAVDVCVVVRSRPYFSWFFCHSFICFCYQSEYMSLCRCQVLLFKGNLVIHSFLRCLPSPYYPRNANKLERKGYLQNFQPSNLNYPKLIWRQKYEIGLRQFRG